MGVLGKDSSTMQTWLAHYLELLSEVWLEMRKVYGEAVCPDCLWFSWDNQSESFFPLSYAQSLRFLREAAVESGLTAGTLQAQALTLHSMKVCLLSAMLVLKLSRTSRCAQGHHRGSSAELYSRDDVWEALDAQSQVLSQLHAGWLPLTPIARGGQLPIQQLPLLQCDTTKPLAAAASCFPLLPDVSSFLPGSAVACGVPEELGEVQAQSDPMPPQPELQGQSFDSSSSEGEPADLESLGCAEEVLFLRAKSGIIHVAAPASSGMGVQHGSLWLKPTCGMLSPELFCITSVPSGARLCRHKACQGFWGDAHSSSVHGSAGGGVQPTLHTCPRLRPGPAWRIDAIAGDFCATLG